MGNKDKTDSQKVNQNNQPKDSREADLKRLDTLHNHAYSQTGKSIPLEAKSNEKKQGQSIQEQLKASIEKRDLLDGPIRLHATSQVKRGEALYAKTRAQEQSPHHEQERRERESDKLKMLVEVRNKQRTKIEERQNTGIRKTNPRNKKGPQL